MLYINQLNNSREYKDTINVFLKLGLVNLPNKYSLNNYNFLIFKSKLVEALLYNS